MTDPGAHAADRASLTREWRVLLAGLFANRIRLHSLPPGARWLAATALALGGLLVTLLVLTPLDIALPGGTIAISAVDDPMDRVVLSALMVAIAAALAAIAHGAGSGALRNWRLALAGVALVALATVPTDVEGFGPPWSSPLMLLGLSSGLALLVPIVVGKPRWPWVVASLAAIPPLSGLVMVLTAGMFEPLPPGYSAAWFETLELTNVMQRLGAIEAMFIVLGLWAAIEYGRGLAGASGRSVRLRSRFWVLLPVLLTLKVAWLVSTSMGWLPAPLVPAQTAAAMLFHQESVLSLVQAVLFAGFIGWWLAQRRRGPASDGAITAVLLVSVPLVGAFILPQLGLAVDGFVGDVGARFGVLPRDPNAGTQLDWFAQFVSNSQSTLLAAAPAIAAYFAAATGIWAAARRNLTAGSIFLLAFAAWTIVPATSWLLREGFGAVGLFDGPFIGDGSEALLGQVHPITLDIAITLVVAVLTVVWYTRWHRIVRPPELLIVLVLSTVVAYGGGVAGGLGVLLFWIGLGFPFVAQFAFDARGLNATGRDREGRVLAALGLALLILATTLTLISLGYVSPERPGFEAFAKRLLVVPLVAVLAAAAIFKRSFYGEMPSSSSEASSSAGSR